MRERERERCVWCLREANLKIEMILSRTVRNIVNF